MDILYKILELRNLGLSEIKERYQIREEHITADARYQKLSELTEVYNPEVFPVRFFFRNDKLILMYSSDEDIVGKLNGKKIKAQYGDKENNHLRSRAGKRSNLIVYPKEGFAVSVESDEVQFIELFQPTTMELYKKEIYVEVGPFIR